MTLKPFLSHNLYKCFLVLIAKMGRIKTRLVKALTHELLDIHGDKFTTSYDENKVKVTELTEIKSKKLRNIVAGYVTRMKKARAE